MEDSFLKTENKILKERVSALQTSYHENLRVKRLSDNHIRNLEDIIANLRDENTELIKQNAYYNANLSLIFRCKRKIKHLVNKYFPKGTRKRKHLRYLKMCLLHPIRFFKLITTAEGRNRIEGDYSIGEDYFRYGKLIFSKEENPKVSIIIPVYNQIYYTYTCLYSIWENVKDIPYEIILADDVSTDKTKEIGKFCKNLVIARNKTNQGFLLNCNQAAAKARGEYIVFLNNDTKVCKNWLSSLLELIESDDNIGLVGSKLIYPDGRLQEAGGIIWNNATGMNYGRFDRPDKHEYNYVKEVDFISGASIMLRRALWEEIGGFDVRFAPAYCEDVDLAFEIKRRGKKVLYQPKSEIIHFEGVSNGTDVHGSGLKKYQLENFIKLKEKWEDVFAGLYSNDVKHIFRARDKSKDKKIILFIDHYVPTFDKDAGSRIIYQYIELLLSKGYMIKFLTDSFRKDEPYTSILESMGVEVLYGEGDNIYAWISENKEDIDIAYMTRPHISMKYIDFIKENTNIKVIYNGCDLHFLREQREYEISGDIAKKKQSEASKYVELDILKKADMNYYYSQVEIDTIKEMDTDIKAKAIVSCVYEKFKDNDGISYADKRDILFVGGFAHAPNVDAIKYFISEIWTEVRQKLNINLYIVGSAATEEIKALDSKENGIIFKGFVSDEELENLYRNVRVVIVPLRFGAGIKGKVIEALYNGKPLITTSIGAEGIPAAKEVMLIEDDTKAYTSSLIALYEDVERLEGMSQKAMEYIREYNSFEAAWRIIEEDFK